MGIKQVITTLLEESTHLKTGFHDETRALETFLFQAWVSEMENRLGLFN